MVAQEPSVGHGVLITIIIPQGPELAGQIMGRSEQ